jgi:hypothetical protein
MKSGEEKTHDLDRFPEDLPNLHLDDFNLTGKVSKVRESKCGGPTQSGNNNTKKAGGKCFPTKKTGRRSFSDAFDPIQVSDTDSQGSVHEVASTSASAPKPPRERTTTKSFKEMAFMDAMTKALSKDSGENDKPNVTKLDDISIFTEHVGRQLRALPDRKKVIIMQNAINSAIFDTQMSFCNQTDVAPVIDITTETSNLRETKRQHLQDDNPIIQQPKQVEGHTPPKTLAKKKNTSDIAQPKEVSKLRKDPPNTKVSTSTAGGLKSSNVSKPPPDNIRDPPESALSNAGKVKKPSRKTPQPSRMRTRSTNHTRTGHSSSDTSYIQADKDHDNSDGDADI